MRTTPFRHPLATHSALDVLGYRRNGSPIYAIAGGNGEGEGGSGGTPPAPPAGNPPTPPPAAPPAPPAAPAAPPAEGDVKSLPDWAQKLLKDTNAEAAKSRVNAKEHAAKEAREELLRQLSGDANKPLTAEQLAQKLQEAESTATTAQQELIAERIEKQVYRTAQSLGANADKLLDSRAFCDDIDTLDPADPKEFATQVEAKIKAALEKDTSLRAGQAPRRGGGEFAGGPGTTGRPASLGQAVAARLSG